MRPRRAPRVAPLALALLMAGTAACSAAIPSSDIGTLAGASAGASLAAASSAPSAPPSASAGDASASPSTSVAAASPSAAPTPKPTPKPTPRPTPAPTAALGYQCASLLRNSEVRKATGLSDATLVGNHNGTPQETGQTYCPYVAQSGQVTVAAAVWTGSSYAAFLKLWDSVSTYSQQAPGIGSQAIIDAGDGVGLAIVGKVGVSIQIKGPSGVPAGVDAWTACQTLLTLLAKRV